jgi:hypothetical protein
MKALSSLLIRECLLERGIVRAGLACLAVVLFVFLSIGNASQGPAPAPPQPPGDIQLVDYTYLGERPHWYGAVPPRRPVWVDIPIPTDQIIISDLLFVVSDSDWTFAICEDKNFGGCTFPVLRGSSFGWSGDYAYSAEPIPYVDRNGSKLIHVLVEGEDWFTFRALIHYTVN